MALICPFRGYRYNKEVVGDLNLVVTQPYDKISPELQKTYHDRSPYNVARITKSREKNQNPDTDYPEAGATFQQWLEAGVLVQDSAPAIYAYFQEYEFEGETILQRGFISLLDLKHSGRSILPHERTLAEPKMDRLRLLRRIRCNEDFIYTLYTDDKLTINRVLAEKTSSCQPDIDVQDDFGVSHRVWTITDQKTIRKIQDSMVPEELFIADGHHRFETAVNFMKECTAQGLKAAAPESFDKRMITCFNSADQGTTILPTHRLVRDLEQFNSLQFLSLAEPYFAAEPVHSTAELWEKMKGARGDHVFGFYAGDTKTAHLLRLKEEGKVDPMMLAHAEAYRHLDVSILHTLILDRLLGIDESKLVSQSHVDYARDRVACIQRVDEGKYQAAFFLNPTTVEQVQRVALLGERMPQKSTDFYPKLLTGLVFMAMAVTKSR
ncbi:MAG: hypothetical protein H6Q32_772 [Bacteroidetes bacterium]|nr:hypothetical protein [Bacteroidota bacterium]